jgi:hypothetical protein
MHAALSQVLVSAGQSCEAHDQYVQSMLNEWQKQPEHILKIVKIVVQKCQVCEIRALE